MHIFVRILVLPHEVIYWRQSFHEENIMRRLPLYFALILASLLAACGSISPSSNQGSAITPTPTTQPAQPTATPSPTPLAHFKVGQTVQVGNIWQITVTKPQRVTPGQYDYIKKPGDVILMISVSLKNISSGEQTVYSYGQFTLRDSTGTAASPTYIQSAQQPPNGKVEANMPISGDLVYEIPPGEHHFTLAFETNLFAPGQTIWDITA
jgi:hypothetical protein